MLLVLGGAVFALLLIIDVFFAGAQRERWTRREIGLMAGAILLPLAALIQNGVTPTPDPAVQNAALVLAAALAAGSLVAWALGRRRAIRSLIGAGAILLAALIVPFAAAYFALLDETPVTPAPPPEAELTAEATAAPTDDAGRTAIDALFRAIREILLAELTNVEESVLFALLDAGTPVAEVVRLYEGDLERVITRVTEAARTVIRQAAAMGALPPLQAALILSQMETVVRIAVNTNLNRITDLFGGPTPTGTRPSLSQILTGTPAPARSETPQPSAAPSPAG